jgi:hypothetical protein
MSYQGRENPGGKTREGKPGREPIVLGFWGEGTEVRVAEALAK